MHRILIATGGTGGHIYPGLVTAEELRRRGCSVMFIGAFGPAQQKINDAGFPCVSIAVKGFVAKRSGEKAAAIGAMVKAFVACLGIIRRERPAVVLGFGGYSSFPVVMASVCSGVPVVLHEQNAVPGQANKALALFARRVAVGFRETVGAFSKGKAVWTGNPLRLFDALPSRDKAREELGLDPRTATVLVFGGSQGSRALNACVAGVFAVIPAGIKVQVIHMTGREDPGAVKARYQELGVAALVRGYMENMALAYAAADLVVGRAGAGTVTELGLLGIPSVLIPYPGANDHQKFNARVLERLGMASIIEEKLLRQDILRDKIFSALRREPSPAEQARVREQLRGEFIPDGAKRLCDELLRGVDA